MNTTCIVEGCEAQAFIFGSGGVDLCREHSDALREWQNALADQATEAAGGPEVQTCPRRNNEYGPWETGEGLDVWRLTHNYRAELHRTCSFCGSLHPDDFIAHLRDDEWVLGPTDKNYKAYLGPVSEGSSLPDFDGPVGEQSVKFYYQHLSVDQRQVFIAMLNEQVVKIGYPGHLYVLPFFIARPSFDPEVSSAG